MKTRHLRLKNGAHAHTIHTRTQKKVFMGRTYAGAREDMSDIIGASSTGFEGAVYAGEGYHREGGGETGVPRAVSYTHLTLPTKA